MHRPRAAVMVFIIASTTVLCLADVADAAASAAAMSCCAATNYSCAGMRPPDDCCRVMHHLAAQPAATVAQVAAHDVAAVPPLALATPFAVPNAWRSVVSLATRLHDPPHLHTFALLI